ncbi:histidine kinase [Anaerocolumna sp. AGMB13025]|uniref:cache domain-containing sensor histidine kinase n=1 Tax=Anaerocolumna sp. AGMB13025 TaxID=3039116 RepID=UPI00241E28DF|nr:sensor histidine kinase [Anaerocolumna sp. AGMB13025]WFR56627.1 histidine kinase [Anaerocolumna sp. AGMB13025]
MLHKLMVKKFLSLNLFKKLMIMLLLISILPIFLIQFISYKISTSTIERQTKELIMANLKQSSNSVDEFFHSYDKIIMDMYTDSSYIDNLKYINVWDSKNYYTAKHRIEEKLENIVYVYPEILGIAIVGLNGDATFYDTITLSGEESFCFDIDHIRIDPMFKDSLSVKHAIYSSTVHKSDFNYGNKNYFYIAHQLTDFNNYENGPVGSIILCIDENALRNVYTAGMDFNSNLTFLINENGDIISFPIASFVGLNLYDGYSNNKGNNYNTENTKNSKENTDSRKENTDSRKVNADSRKVNTENRNGNSENRNSDTENRNGNTDSRNGSSDNRNELMEGAIKNFFIRNNFMNSKKLEVHVSSIKDGVFTLINVQNLTYALKDVQNISMIIVLIGILVGMVCILISMSFAATTDKSVKKIIHAMGKADQGDYDIRIAIDGKDEFATIAHHFNDMIIRIKDSNKQEVEALVREKNAEIKSLEAQINPHFLYNTLDAINWVALEHEEFHISKMLINLAAILRYSIQKSNEIVTIQEELEYLKRYIYLQQQRFCYSFQCMIHMDDTLMCTRIHKLLIQPLIENTIVHGFPGSTDHDEIDIEISREGAFYVQIQVKDNGKGMSKELAEVFNSYDYKKDKIETSIGVRNVITRLKLYYGGNSYFHVDSSEQGTTVTILIPYEI